MPPLQVEGGITARTRRGAIGETWWSARFVAVLESFAIGSRLHRGRRYARSGQVLDLRVEPGLVRARVQGTRRTPYDVRIRVTTLDERAWTEIEDALAAQALFAARLLTGDMPREIEDVFGACDLSLFPAAARELETDCSCPDFANPCKHIAASFYILAEAFDDDPFLIFAWRGRPREQLVANLRRLRGAAGPTMTEATGDTDAPNTVVPLAQSIDAFWRMDPSFDGVHAPPHASDSPDALLRQLGPPPLEAGGPALLEYLTSAYHTIAAGAERFAYEESQRSATQSAGAAVEPTARTCFTDMRHLETADEHDLTPAARRLYAFCASVVRAGTSIPGGAPVQTPLQCSRRRGRYPCRGRVVVEAIEEPLGIAWRCTACGEAGVLCGWDCSLLDLGGRRRPDVGSSEPWIETTLSEELYLLLEKLDVLDVPAEQLIRGALYMDGVIRLEGPREAYEALREDVAAAIETSRSRRRAALQRLERMLPR
jgi:uncharacterized Zn finger protein